MRSATLAVAGPPSVLGMLGLGLSFEIHEETAGDVNAIRVVVRGAFGGDAEPRLVDRLRSDGLITKSLVASAGDLVVGHVLFSPITIETAAGDVLAAALGPVAVLPEYRRQGIGSALIRTGLEACRSAGKSAVLVVGEPAFYRRFGFSSTLARKLISPYSHFGEPWMALELKPRALHDPGFVRYPEAFTLV